MKANLTHPTTPYDAQRISAPQPPPLPLSCTVGQFLRLCCAHSTAAAPALLGPWVGAGQANDKIKSVTAASDGETVCVWIAGRDRSYPEWSSLSPMGASGSSPLAKFRPLYRAGARHPLASGAWVRPRVTAGPASQPLPAPASTAASCWRVEILGAIALLPSGIAWALAHCDSCHLGVTNQSPVNYLHHSVSIKAALQGKIIQGVILCPQHNYHPINQEPVATH